MSIYSRGFIRGYGKIESVMGDPGSYTNPTRTTTTAITVVYLEQVGALDGFVNAIFTLRSTVPLVRSGQITYEGNTWDVVDVRDSEDGVQECRAIRPDLTS